MITPRERIRIGLMFAGIVIFFCGAAISCSSSSAKVDQMASHVGAWKAGAARGVPKEIAPWLIGSGIAAVISSFAVRGT